MRILLQTMNQLQKVNYLSSIFAYKVKEIREYAKYLGMDVEKDHDLLYIAKEGLKAVLPIGWQACRTPKGFIYYVNLETKESTWEHPLDQYYRAKYQEAKAQLMQSDSSKQSPKRKILRFGAKLKRKDKPAESISSNEVSQVEAEQITPVDIDQTASENNTSLTMVPVNHYRYLTPRRESQGTSERLQAIYDDIQKRQQQNSQAPSASLTTLDSHENLQNLNEAANFEKKIEEHMKNRLEELEFYKDKKHFEFVAQKKEIEAKYQSRLKALIETKDADSNKENLNPMSNNYALLDPEAIEEIEVSCAENFLKKRGAARWMYDNQEKELSDNLACRNQEKILEMTAAFRRKVKVSIFHIYTAG